MTKGLEMAQTTWTKSRDTGIDRSDAARATSSSVIAVVIDGKDVVVVDVDDVVTATSFEAKPEGGLRQSKHKGLMMLTMLEDETPEDAEEEEEDDDDVSIAMREPPSSSIPTNDDEEPFTLQRSHRQVSHQSPLLSLTPPPSSP